jgi:hypothetical protein
MPNGASRSRPSRGRITSGISGNTLIERTLDFVWRELPAWRDDARRSHEEAEERLNAQLCKYLNAASRQRFPMVFFHHEEKQSETRRVDFSALPSECRFVGETFHSIYDPFLVFEGKRLPAPSRDREREYVTGGLRKSGGIQRFKLGLHGAKHETAAIIGYIQEGELVQWLDEVNSWIVALAKVATPGEEEWSASEQLMIFDEDTGKGTARCQSTHTRGGGASIPQIRLRHMWVRTAGRK